MITMDERIEAVRRAKIEALEATARETVTREAADLARQAAEKARGAVLQAEAALLGAIGTDPPSTMAQRREAMGSPRDDLRAGKRGGR